MGFTGLLVDCSCVVALKEHLHDEHALRLVHPRNQLREEVSAGSVCVFGSPSSSFSHPSSVWLQGAGLPSGVNGRGR